MESLLSKLGLQDKVSLFQEEQIDVESLVGVDTMCHQVLLTVTLYMCVKFYLVAGQQCGSGGKVMLDS